MKHAACVVGALWFAYASVFAWEPLDGIALTVNRGVGGTVVLTWTGGEPTYKIFRSTAPQTVTTAGNERTETSGMTYTDPTPDDAPLFYYLATSSPRGQLAVTEALSPEGCPPSSAKDHTISAQWSSPYHVREIRILRNGDLLVQQTFDCPETATLETTALLAAADEAQTTVTLCYQQPDAALTDEVRGCPIAGATYLSVGASRQEGEQRTLGCAGAPVDSSWSRIQNGEGDVAPAAHVGADYPIAAAHESTPIDDVTVRRTHTDFDGDTSVSESKLTVVRLLLQQLTYLGEGFRAVTKDADATDYPSPHWLDSDLDGDADDPGDNKFPVSFRRNSTVGIGEVKFGVEPVGLPACDVPVQGAGPDGDDFQGTGQIIGGELSLSTSLVSDDPLPNAVTFYGPYRIVWTAKYADAQFSDSGTSDNTIYVTLEEPLGEARESYFDIGTKAAGGQSDVQSTFDAIWSDFADLSVVNVRGQRLGYYRGMTCGAELDVYDAPALVNRTNGQCGAWADLLAQCARTQGIDGAEFVTIQPYDPALPTDCAGQTNASSFLVRNHAFAPGAGTSGCDDYPYRFDDPCSIYPKWPAGTVEVTDAPGIPGQDEPNPASWFGGHYIVKFNMKYYDPSYGAGPFEGTKDEANLTWEQGAVDGYCGYIFRTGVNLVVREDIVDLRETSFDR